MSVDVPDRWKEIDLGLVKLYCRRQDNGTWSTELVYHSEYFGGVQMYTVYWIRHHAEPAVLFREPGADREAQNTIEWAMKTSPGRVHSTIDD